MSDKKNRKNGKDANVDVEVIGISVCPPYQGYVVILKEQGGERWLPIFIGAAEAQAISLLLQGMEYARPLTYDLFDNILAAGGVEIRQVTVTELRDNTYYALVHMKDLKGEVKDIDARPSDAIALALKTKASIQVAKQVMDSAAITGEPVSQTKVDLVSQLNQKLKEAIEIEAYEEAAKIRDQIRALEQKDKPDTGKGKSDRNKNKSP
jgi:bifunctional DNase/RNase